MNTTFKFGDKVALKRSPSQTLMNNITAVTLCGFAGQVFIAQGYTYVSPYFFTPLNGHK